MNKKKWLIIVISWQVIGFCISIVRAIVAGSFHGFIYYLLETLTFVNSIAILGNILIFVFEKKIAHKIKHNAVNLFISLLIVSFAVYLGTDISLFIVKHTCDIGVKHIVDKGHIFLLIINLIITLASTIVYGLFFLYEKLKKDMEQKIQEIEGLKRLQVESKLAILQSKVNPHFLFNTLNTMMDLVYQKPGKVEKVILNLSDIYRKVLTLPDSELIPLGDEIKLVREYLEIEKIRMGDRLDYEISVDEELCALKIPPLIIEIVVENAVQHGLTPKKRGGEIHISVHVENNSIIIKVTDNGIGIDGNQKSTTGFGIYSVEQRLKLLYKDRAKFEIVELAEGGTQATMELPYEN